jgi:hypothetical protein
VVDPTSNCCPAENVFRSTFLTALAPSSPTYSVLPFAAITAFRGSLPTQTEFSIAPVLGSILSTEFPSSSVELAVVATILPVVDSCTTLVVGLEYATITEVKVLFAEAARIESAKYRLSDEQATTISTDSELRI